MKTNRLNKKTKRVADQNSNSLTRLGFRVMSSKDEQNTVNYLLQQEGAMPSGICK